MRFLPSRSLSALALAVAIAAPLRAQRFDPNPVWPVSGTATPDLPFSSTFGPRLKASESYRYDFHRGIDIPCPLNTPLHAIADGVIRINGSDPGYSDGVVQIRHLRPGFSTCGTGNVNCYFSNYLHISGIPPGQNANDAVVKGQIVAYSGQSVSEFDHLHFEIRDGGLFQKNCIHPLNVLPYNDSQLPAVSFTAVNSGNPLLPAADVSVTLPATVVDLNRVELFVYTKAGGSLALLDHHEYDMQVWNLAWTHTSAEWPAPSCLFAPVHPAGSTYDPYIHLDNSAFNNVAVSPAVFSETSVTYQAGFHFTGVNGPASAANLVLQARASDLKGQWRDAWWPAAASDADGDGVDDSYDCAAGNNSLWAIPSEAENLRLAGKAPITLTWSASAAAGGTAAALYDLLRSASAADFITPAITTCVISNGSALAAGDSPPAASFFYRVRAEDSCGGNLGVNSAGTPAAGRACP